MRNEDMIAVLECFIHHRTNKEIRIAKPRTPQQYLLLTQYYEKCIPFFIK
jgi:hypothetical protein